MKTMSTIAWLNCYVSKGKSDMAKNDLEKLFIQLELNSKKLEKQFSILAKNIDKQLTEIEERTKQFETNVNRIMGKAETTFAKLAKLKKAGK